MPKTLILLTRPLISLLLILSFCVALFPSSAQPARAQTPFTPSYKEAPCPPNPLIALQGIRVEEGQDIFCGYVTVPEEHNNPNGRTLSLAVAVIPSIGENPAPDPLVIAQGGPGGSTLDYFTATLFQPIYDDLRASRDMVLIEQRGTRHSDPFLFCDEVYNLLLETLTIQFTYEESLPLSITAYEECRARFIAEGINLNAFDSIENAADIPLIMAALGYETYNFYGVSYGTLLGQHLMRDYPDGLRSVILDAVVPMETGYVLDTGLNISQALRLLFETCAEQPSCNSLYSRLEFRYLETIRRLNAEPVLLENVQNFLDGQRYDILLTGDMFALVVIQLLYSTPILPVLPSLIYAVSEGNYFFMEALLPILLLDDSLADGMYYSVLCAEDGDFTEDEILRSLEGVYAEIIDLVNPEVTALGCALWDVEPLGEIAGLAVQSDIPTLLLSGQFDPVTPAVYADIVAASLSQAYNYVFPGVGHGAIEGGDCPLGIMLSFLNAPDQIPDTECISEMGITFE